MTQNPGTDLPAADKWNERCRQTIIAYLAAFNECSIDKLAELLDDTVRLEDWTIQAEGKAAVLKATHAILHEGPKLRVVLRKTIVQARHAAADLTINVAGAGQLAVVDLFDFTADGLISSIRAFKGAEYA